MSVYADDAWQSLANARELRSIQNYERAFWSTPTENSMSDGAADAYAQVGMAKAGVGLPGSKNGPLADFEKAEVASYNPKLFVTKDSGKRDSFDGGMVRDTAAGKMRPDLVKDGPMFLRWVGLLTRGAIKYAARNWMKARGQEEYDRFLESADRHYEIWSTWRRYGINIEDLDNPTTEPLKEDHAAAAYFNINGAEFVADKNPAVTPSVK